MNINFDNHCAIIIVFSNDMPLNMSVRSGYRSDLGYWRILDSDRISTIDHPYLESPTPRPHQGTVISGSGPKLPGVRNPSTSDRRLANMVISSKSLRCCLHPILLGLADTRCILPAPDGFCIRAILLWDLYTANVVRSL